MSALLWCVCVVRVCYDTLSFIYNFFCWIEGARGGGGLCQKREEKRRAAGGRAFYLLHTAYRGKDMLSHTNPEFIVQTKLTSLHLGREKDQDKNILEAPCVGENYDLNNWKTLECRVVFVSAF